jgi:PAP2 superfamily protein
VLRSQTAWKAEGTGVGRVIDQMGVPPLGVFSFLSRLLDVLDPFNWNSETYLTSIACLLLLRLLISWPEHGIGRFLEETCLILPAGLLYFSVRGLEHASQSAAIEHARQVVSFERALGILVEPDLQRTIVDHPALVDLFNWIYVWAHWPVILIWVIWMWTRHRDAYPVYRNAVLLSGAAGMIVFALYPLAPPRLFSDLNVVDTVSLHSRSYRVLQPPSLTNLYASMPSLHFGWNLLVGIAIARNARTLLGRAIGVILPIAMFSAIILTANHYIVDGIAGGVFALTGLVVSSYVTPHWSRTLNHLSLGRLGTHATHTRVRGCP